jgi:hypothetical protein
VGVEGEADLVDVGAVDVDGGVELLAGDAELLGPVGDVGGHFGVDLFGVVGALGVGLGLGVGEDWVFGVGDVLDVAVAVVVHVGHGVNPHFCVLEATCLDCVGYEEGWLSKA